MSVCLSVCPSTTFEQNEVAKKLNYEMSAYPKRSFTFWFHDRPTTIPDTRVSGMVAGGAKYSKNGQKIGKK